MKDEEGAIIWKGLRVGVGIHFGTPDTVLNDSTGKVEYCGKPVNRAARVAQTTQGGEILVTEETLNPIHDLQELGNPLISPAGTNVHVVGVQESVTLLRVTPTSLATRKFTPKPSRPPSPVGSDAAVVAQEPPKGWWEPSDEPPPEDNADFEETLRTLLTGGSATSANAPGGDAAALTSKPSAKMSTSSSKATQKALDQLVKQWQQMRRREKLARQRAVEIEKRCTELEKDLRKAQSSLSVSTLEMFKVHRRARFFASIMKTFLGSYSLDRPGGQTAAAHSASAAVPMKEEECVQKLIGFYRVVDDDAASALAQQRTEGGNVSTVSAVSPKRRPYKEEFAEHMRLAIEEERDEEKEKGNSVRLGRSIAGHLTKLFVTTAKYVKRVGKEVQRLAKVEQTLATSAAAAAAENTNRVTGGIAPPKAAAAAAARRRISSVWIEEPEESNTFPPDSLGSAKRDSESSNFPATNSAHEDMDEPVILTTEPTESGLVEGIVHIAPPSSQENSRLSRSNPTGSPRRSTLRPRQ